MFVHICLMMIWYSLTSWWKKRRNEAPVSFFKFVFFTISTTWHHECHGLQQPKTAPKYSRLRTLCYENFCTSEVFMFRGGRQGMVGIFSHSPTQTWKIGPLFDKDAFYVRSCPWNEKKSARCVFAYLHHFATLFLF